MEGNVRSHTRWILLRPNGTHVSGLSIVSVGSSTVLVYTADGTCFEGDLLALESLAKLHRAVAHPVERPPDLPEEIWEELIPNDDENVVGVEPAGDWSDDQPAEESPPGGVSLCGTADPAPVVTQEPVRIPNTAQTGPVQISGAAVSSETAGHGPTTLVIQGGGGGTGAGDSWTNPYHEDPGPGLRPDIQIGYESVRDIIPKYGTVFRKIGVPNKALVLKRDLGLCMRGMPAWAGTTIAGSVRPDTGGIDPRIPDHIQWLEYGVPHRKDPG